MNAAAAIIIIMNEAVGELGKRIASRHSDGRAAVFAELKAQFIAREALFRAARRAIIGAPRRFAVQLRGGFLFARAAVFTSVCDFAAGNNHLNRLRRQPVGQLD